MTTGLKIGIGFAVVSLLLAATVFGCAVGVNNDCVRQEQGLEAQYKQDQNDYAAYFDKVKEMAEVPDMYTADMRKVFDGAMQGRYGSGGSKAVVSFIQEHNPQLDARLYVQIEQAIEAGRNQFEAEQKMLLDKKRVYEVTLGEFPSGSVARMLGFPKKDLTEFDIVTNDATETAFKTKKAGPLSLRDAR